MSVNVVLVSNLDVHVVQHVVQGAVQHHVVFIGTFLYDPSCFGENVVVLVMLYFKSTT